MTATDRKRGALRQAGVERHGWDIGIDLVAKSRCGGGVIKWGLIPASEVST